MSVISLILHNFFISIPLLTMNKSLNRLNRQFGLNIKNTLQENELDSKLILKNKPKKVIQNSQNTLKTHRQEMKYSEEILKYAFTTITYPYILKSSEKVKRDIESLLFQVTAVNGQNCLWHEDFLTLDKNQKTPFYNPSITLQKRSALVQWLILVHKKYTLREQTLHLAIKLIDDHCVKNDIPLKRYQLIGVAGFFMAAKFEQIQLPKFKDYYRLISSHFSDEQMKMAESQILCKAHFLLTKKITTLWYLQAFGLQNIIFQGRVNYGSINKQNRQSDQGVNFNKEQQDSISSISSSSRRFVEFMKFSNYVLNLILLDYRISTKHKEDIIAISALVFTTYQDDFADADTHGLIRYFASTKERLVEENQTKEDIGKQVKKCVKKIEQLFKKRFEKRFNGINGKFGIIEVVQ